MPGVALQSRISPRLAGDWRCEGAVAEAPAAGGHLELAVDDGMSRGENRTLRFVLG
jgi:hypothetical protein